MKTQNRIHRMAFKVILSLIIGISTRKTDSGAQVGNETPVTFEKKLEITITNPIRLERLNEPVCIPLATLKEKAPDFNRNFFRVKHPAGGFEPLDIPSQLRTTPGAAGAEEIVFLIDIEAGKPTSVELWYNPSGSGLPGYPVKARSFDRWYTDGSNLAWENEVIAYRTYNGVVDYFAKSYPHLRLHDLPPDSYHHEKLWGLDPYVIGAKPGLGGILLCVGAVTEKLYGRDASSQLSFRHHASGDGAVFTEAVVDVLTGEKKRFEIHYVLYAGHHDNEVTVVLNTGSGQPAADVLVAPGMQKFKEEWFVMDRQGGFCYSFGSPLGEYGTIATAFIWNPEDLRDVVDTGESTFIKLKPDSEGQVHYRSVAVWYRASADQPESSKAFEEYVKGMAQCFRNPVKVTIFFHRD